MYFDSILTRAVNASSDKFQQDTFVSLHRYQTTKTTLFAFENEPNQIN